MNRQCNDTPASHRIAQSMGHDMSDPVYSLDPNDHLIKPMSKRTSIILYAIFWMLLITTIVLAIKDGKYGTIVFLIIYGCIVSAEIKGRKAREQMESSDEPNTV